MNPISCEEEEEEGEDGGGGGGWGSTWDNGFEGFHRIDNWKTIHDIRQMRLEVVEIIEDSLRIVTIVGPSMETMTHDVPGLPPRLNNLHPFDFYEDVHKEFHHTHEGM